ncbi:KpsF/GutQ family sugar-phosphate isomerase [soil metagenome]
MAKESELKRKKQILKNALDVIITEVDGVLKLASRIHNKTFAKNFVKCIELILACRGKVIVTGVGKSAIIARKIVATLNSTGTYSIFLHSSDSLHGDLGMVRAEDIVIIISKSGESSEVNMLIQVLKNLEVKIIALTGNMSSFLAKNSDVALDVSVPKEACPHDLAPTTSTTTALVLGDTIAVTLLKAKDFTKEDFAKWHPGGLLGKRLLLKVSDLIKDKKFPSVNENAGIKDIIYNISSGRLGCVVVLNNKKLSGFITDGDIRRLLEKNINNLSEVQAKHIMNPDPKTIKSEMLAGKALEIMEENKITQLVISENNKPLGIIHLHKLLEEGL